MIEIKNADGKVLMQVDAQNLFGANMRDTSLYGANLRGAKLRGADLTCADLCGADLSGVDLSDANLSAASMYDANLRGASLYSADLTRADLTRADLACADLRDGFLSGANLSGAKLRGADLTGANLSGADLRGADLRGADLTGADLTGAKVPHFQIVPERGSFIAWKKTTCGVIRIRIPKDAKRTSTLVGRKCRASHVIVLGGPGCGGRSPRRGSVTYAKGATVVADKYDGDIRIECTHGIHFFMTKAEAEAEEYTT